MNHPGNCPFCGSETQYGLYIQPVDETESYLAAKVYCPECDAAMEDNMIVVADELINPERCNELLTGLIRRWNKRKKGFTCGMVPITDDNIIYTASKTAREPSRMI